MVFRPRRSFTRDCSALQSRVKERRGRNTTDEVDQNLSVVDICIAVVIKVVLQRQTGLITKYRHLIDQKGRQVRARGLGPDDPSDR